MSKLCTVKLKGEVLQLVGNVRQIIIYLLSGTEDQFIYRSSFRQISKKIFLLPLVVFL